MSERPSFVARLLRPVVQLRDGESTTALLMFLYSFLAMTSYNIIKPITRSQFISSLGADDLPWVTFGMGVTIGVIMQGYTRVIATVPRRWMIPVTQVGIAGMLVLGLTACWFLFRVIHYCVDTWKKNSKVKLEAEAATSTVRKNISWT